MSRSSFITALSLSACLLSSCSLAPSYRQPAAAVAPAFPTGPAYTNADTPKTLDHTASEIAWQDFFTDPALRTLLGIALRENRDLRSAIATLAQDQARYRLQRSQQLPALGASGSAAYEGLSKNGLVAATTVPSTEISGASGSGTADSGGGGQGGGTQGAGGSTVREYTASAGITSYELDLFGRLRNLSRQAFETYLAQAENRRAVQLSVIGNVASAYITWRADAALLDVATETARTQRDSLRLAQAEFDQGTTTLLTLRQAQTALATAQASQAQYTRQVAQDVNEIVLLIGAPLPANLPTPRPLGEQTLMADLPAGLPADLLTRRPDIMKAEHTLRADDADIGAARAAFLPQITLTGTGGLSSLQFNKLFTPGSLTWSFAPQISIPIFTAGQTRANLDVAKTQRDIDVAAYDLAIQTAFHDVANALAARATYRDQAAAQEANVAAARDYNRLALLRFHSGVDSYLTALDAERTLFTAQQSLLTARQAQLVNLVTLYQDLGGGWKNKE